MIINIKIGVKNIFELNVEPEDTIMHLKELISKKTKLPILAIDLFYRRRILCDDQTIASYHTKIGSTLHLISKFKIPFYHIFVVENEEHEIKV